MSLRVSQRITGEPTNTGSQQVRTRYSSTDGTLTAAGTPKAASPPISAASTAPTPPGVGAADASVPPTIVTTVTVTNVAWPPNASTLVHNANAAPRVVPVQPKTINDIRLGSRATSMMSVMTSLSLGVTDVDSQRRKLGTNRKTPTMPSATPAIRYNMVDFGTKWDRSVPAPAAVLKKISNTMCMITCIDCCSATAVVARVVLRPLFCRIRVLSASPPTPAGVVVAAKVLATCAIDSRQKFTDSSALAHSAAAAPTYVDAEIARPSSAHHQLALPSALKNVGTVLMNGYATYTSAPSSSSWTSWLRLNRVTASAWIFSVPVWRITAARLREMTPLASLTESRMCLGTAVLVSRRDAVSTASLPSTSIAAATASSAPYSADVVTNNCAMSA